MANHTGLNARPDIAVIWPMEGPMEAFHNESATCLSGLKHNGELESRWQDYINDQLEDIHYPEKLMTYKNPSDLLLAQFELVNEIVANSGRESQSLGEAEPEATGEPVQTAGKFNTIT